MTSHSIVTGGCGFIGSHLTELLLARGHHVTVIDSLITGRKANLAGVAQNPLLKIVEADLSQPGSWTDSFAGADRVYHLAALADIVPSLQKPLDYYAANVTATARVLEAARHYNLKRFLYVASSSCYGLAEEYPTPETAPIKPEYPYALTKWLGEQMVFHWGQVFGLSVVSCRLFNVFGPRSRTTGAYGAVFGVFLKQKLAGQPLTIVGDGTQTRDFTFVTDVVEALWTASESDARGECFNVGSGKPQAVNYLAELLGGARHSIPKRPGEPDCTFADIRKIQQRLGWKPRFTFEQGVQRMLESIEDWRDAPLWTPDTIKEATKDWFQYLDRPKASAAKSV